LGIVSSIVTRYETGKLLLQRDINKYLFTNFKIVC